MSGFDPNISNGSCYYDDSGNEAPSRYIPCGSSADGHVPCCESQDNCLSSNACYNAQFGVTYLAGCTDKSYSDSSCPSKGDYSNQYWVGLVYCNGTSNKWAGCHESDDAETVTVPEPCWCPKTSAVVLFEDAAVLGNIMHLPTATGETVSWFGGFGPSTAASTSSSASTTSSSSRSSSRATTTDETTIYSSTSMPTITSPANITSAIAFPSPTASAQQADLRTGAKVGIGVGAGLGALALLALLIWLIQRWLRRKEQDAEHEEKGQATPDYARVSQVSEPVNGDLRSPAWSGHKSELPANESTLTPSPTYADFRSNKSEVEGSPAIGSTGRPLSNGGFEMPGQKGTLYEMPG